MPTETETPSPPTTDPVDIAVLRVLNGVLQSLVERHGTITHPDFPEAWLLVKPPHTIVHAISDPPDDSDTLEFAVYPGLRLSACACDPAATLSEPRPEDDPDGSLLRAAQEQHRQRKRSAYQCGIVSGRVPDIHLGMEILLPDIQERHPATVLSFLEDRVQDLVDVFQGQRV